MFLLESVTNPLVRVPRLAEAVAFAEAGFKFDGDSERGFRIEREGRPHLALGTGCGLAIRPPQLMDDDEEKDDPEGDGDLGAGLGTAAEPVAGTS